MTGPCSIADCSRRSRTRGWCSTHYERWRVHGDPNHETWARIKKCQIVDCAKPNAASGLCSMHYSRKQRKGDALAPTEFRGVYSSDVCAVDGCAKPREKRGWCSKHYTRWQNNGDPLVVQINRDRPYKASPATRRRITQTRYARLRDAACEHGPGCVTKFRLCEIRQQACFYCGDAGGTADHFAPIARGGLHCIENLVPACWSCNVSKNDADPWEWWTRRTEVVA